MTLIAESQLGGNLRNRLPMSQEALGLSNPHALQIGVRGQVHLPFKDAMDVIRNMALHLLGIGACPISSIVLSSKY